MNQHVDKAMELRNEMPMVNNCAQTIMRVYADELGMNEEQAAAIGCTTRSLRGARALRWGILSPYTMTPTPRRRCTWKATGPRWEPRCCMPCWV